MHATCMDVAYISLENHSHQLRGYTYMRASGLEHMIPVRIIYGFARTLDGLYGTVWYPHTSKRRNRGKRT